MAGKHWTSEELTFLRQNYGCVSDIEIANVLGRSEASIQLKANRIGVYTDFHWKPDQEQFLIQNYDLLTNKEIAKYLGFDFDRVQRKADLLNLKKCPKREPFSDLEINFIVNNHKTLTMTQIMEALGASFISIKKVLLNHNLKKVQPQHWTEVQENTLKEWFGKISVSEIGRLLNKSGDTVQAKAAKLGLTKEPGYTTPELLVANLLNELGISFARGKQARIVTGIKPGHSYKPDFLIAQTKIIEVHGDFFHCNPKVFLEGPKYPLQKRTILKDAIKRAWLLDNGFSLIEIWETECEDSELIRSKIVEFMKSS